MIVTLIKQNQTVILIVTLQIDRTLVNHNNASACVLMYFDFHKLPLYPNISVCTCSPRL